VTRAVASIGRVAALASAACLALLAARSAVSTGPSYAFLTWNLFLAWVPYWLALALAAASRRRASRRLSVLLGVVWLLFLPNAPYIASDVVHLEDSRGLEIVLDATVIAAFATTGMFLGFASLREVQAVACARLGPAAGWCVAGVSVVLSGVGIYLGRVQNLNSWDAIVRPGRLAARILHALAHPSAHLSAFAGTLVLGLFLLALYVVANRLLDRRARARQRSR
jgi:uncharacterized membrane protein